MAAPQTIVAGDTVRWPDSFADYPASDGWVLKHRLAPLGTGAPVELTAAADGSAFATTIAAVDSASLSAGVWTIVSWVEKAGETFTVGQRQVQVKPNPRNMVAGFDGRSAARKALEDAKAAFYAFDPAKKRYKIGEREFEFNTASEILVKIHQLEREVQKEDIAAGLVTRPARRIFSRL
jgi:hypothetical protein